MNTIIDRLVADHGHMQESLNALEIKLASSNQLANCTILDMLAILQNLQGDSAKEHHKLEDAVFDLVKTCSRVADCMIETLERDHDRLDSSMVMLTGMLNDQLTGYHTLPQSRIEQEIRSFILYHRNHIRMEEESMFPLFEELMKSVQHDTGLKNIYSDLSRLTPASILKSVPGMH